MAREGYPVEFRRRALDLVAADKPVREVARLLEVSDQSIYSWRRQEQIDRGELRADLGGAGRAAGGASAQS
jgi:transposase-like protein